MATLHYPEKKKMELINLLRGWPSPHLLPADLLKAAANRALSDPEIFVPALQYAPDPGYQPLREELAAWLGRQYNAVRDPDRICITGGASQSLACVLQSYTEPVYTRAVWAVAPCYFLACPIFEDSGFKGRLRAVPEDEEGIDLVWLEKGLVSFETSDPGEPKYKDPKPYRKFYRHIIYVVPTCANPSGKTMTLRRRESLVQLARKHNALIICDDVYDFLQWPILHPPTTSTTTTPQKPLPLPAHALLPRLCDIDAKLGPSAHDADPFRPHGHAISNGSFSKLIGPGVRTGWVASTAAFAFGLSQTGSTRSGGAASQVAAAMICEMMRAGDLDRHVAGTVRPALQRRHGRALRVVREWLSPLGVAVRESSFGGVEDGENSGGGGGGVYGGYFLWLTLPDGGPGAKEIAERVKEEENLIVAPGGIFEVYGDEESVKLDRNIRLCFSWEEEDVVIEGIERLARVMRRMNEEYKDGGKLSFGQQTGQGATGRAVDCEK